MRRRDPASQRGAHDQSRFRVGYIGGLCLIAALTLAGQIVIHAMLYTQSGTADLINIAGRQRMLSQKIAKSALEGDLDELARAASLWESSHEALVDGDPELGLSGDYEPGIERMYTDLGPFVDEIIGSVEVILGGGSDAVPDAVAAVLAIEGDYLARMDAIVHAHAEHGERAVAFLDRIEFVIGGAILLVLILEAVLIFEPLLRRMRSSWNALVRSEDRFKLAVKGSSGAIFDWNLIDNTIYLAPRFAEMIGAPAGKVSDSPHELVGRIASQHLSEFSDRLEDVIRDPALDLDIEFQLTCSDGSERWVLCRGTEERDESGQADRFVGSIADITELKQTQLQLRELAERDALTGLANRSLFSDRLDLRLAKRGTSQGVFAVLFLDFDRFKMINDSLGHDVGDGLLISFAERIKAHLPDSATAARFGGDEFAVLVDSGSSDEITALADGLLEILAEPHQIGKHEITSTASIGVVLDSCRYETSEQMLRDADIAMYEAKRSGRAGVVFFDDAMREQVVEQQRLEHDLAKGDVIEQMRLLYQPIIELESGKIAGFEALVRWIHPVEGEIRPDKFIHIAEECGAIESVGNWVLESASAQLLRWHDAHPELGLRMAINVSRKQLLLPGFVDALAGLADRMGDATGRIVIEVTETAVVDSRVDISSTLETIKRLGFSLAMDDFGTGYSSLSCLHDYPIDYLKIDRSFVKNLEQRREFTAVFAAIVSLANALDLKVVAEGIEVREQLVQLQAMGCEFGQGYLFGKPMSESDADRLLAGDHGEHRTAA